VQVIRQLEQLSPVWRGCAVTIGNFDGVHRGHARILQTLREQAQHVGGRSVVFTFDPHPITLLRPALAPLPITWLERKLSLLEQQGIDAVVVYPTDAALLQLTAEEFFQRIVLDTLAARAMVEGPNFCFGRGRTGDIAKLRELCSSAQVACEVVQPCEQGDELISSSRIRELIQTGQIGAANQYLTQPFRLRGEVVKGAERGRTLGFPTANLQASETVLPAHGVYAARTKIGEKIWPAALNVGPNPTFGEQTTKIELHLCDFSGDLYGQTLEVELLDRLRGIQTFASVAELKDQLRRDVAECREICACGGFAAS
jgi:riboflavin kinase / FMN adenylyltransferase